jgi:hypothetical protein
LRSSAARVVVKFSSDLQLPHSEAVEKVHAAAHGAAWRTLRSKYPGIALRPFFVNLDATALETIERRAAAGVTLRLLSYFAITVPRLADGPAVARAVAAWPHVELAYVEGGVVPPPVHAADDPLSPSQGYLSAAPVAVIGAHSFLQDPWWIGHGTAVLGIVAAVDNDKGVVGIAPGASVRVVSQWFDNSGAPFVSTANAVATAIAAMQEGDVLLLETTTPATNTKFGLVPAEVEPLVFDLIRAATSIGITVVEPAGNSGSNLDALTDTAGKFVFNRATPDFKDSGAIVVGASSSAAPHSRLGFSDYGSRVDCYAWGENIASCGGFPFSGIGNSPQTAYTLTFGGTSGASAIVAGAAVLLQSWAVKMLGHTLSPSMLRKLLSDPSLNTHSNVPLNDRIGVMPDLRRIVRHFSAISISHRWDAIFAILFGGVIYGGGGWSWIPGQPPRPIPPRGERIEPEAMAPERRDLLVGLAMLELAGLVSDPAQRKAIEQSIAATMNKATEKIAADIAKR